MCCCPGHGPLLADPAGPWTTTWRTGPSGWPRCGPRWRPGTRTPAQIVERVYADVPRVLWPAAEMSVRAQLGYLAELGELPGDVQARV